MCIKNVFEKIGECNQLHNNMQGMPITKKLVVVWIWNSSVLKATKLTKSRQKLTLLIKLKDSRDMLNYYIKKRDNIMLSQQFKLKKFISFRLRALRKEVSDIIRQLKYKGV